ncbi:hypothetical protein SK128_007185, partial [Halocaridina rubra]
MTLTSIFWIRVIENVLSISSCLYGPFHILYTASDIKNLINSHSQNEENLTQQWEGDWTIT